MLLHLLDDWSCLHSKNELSRKIILLVTVCKELRKPKDLEISFFAQGLSLKYFGQVLSKTIILHCILVDEQDQLKVLT